MYAFGRIAIRRQAVINKMVSQELSKENKQQKDSM